MALNSTGECQNVHNVVGLNDGTTYMQSEPPSNISYFEVTGLIKSEMCLDSETNSHHQNKLEVDKANNLASCILDVDIEKGRRDILKFSDECVANLKSDDPLAREICLQGGRKFMQLLMNHGTELPKFASRGDRVYDMPANRSKKYKRSPSFNSRRVFFLFSVLSSVGTIILIYLTLKVRLIGDGSGNV